MCIAVTTKHEPGCRWAWDGSPCLCPKDAELTERERQLAAVRRIREAVHANSTAALARRGIVLDEDEPDNRSRLYVLGLEQDVRFWRGAYESRLRRERATMRLSNLKLRRRLHCSGVVGMSILGLVVAAWALSPWIGELIGSLR